MTDQPASSSSATKVSRVAGPQSTPIVQVFALALAVILVGYMFMGRGFAHLGLGPLYVGDWVLLLGLGSGAIALIRHRAGLDLTITTVLLVAFMVLGAARTVPYIGTYGLDALRDGVLWGYAAFALLVLLLFSSARWLLVAGRAYGFLVPIFAIWLPIAWEIFKASQTSVDTSRPGSNLPLVFFKAGDMAVHATAALAFIVIAPQVVATLRASLARFTFSIPFIWTVFLAGATSRGAILASATGAAGTIVISPRRANWAPTAAAIAVVAVALTVPSLLPAGIVPPPVGTPSSSATSLLSPVASASLGPSGSVGPSPAPSPSAPAPTPQPGRNLTPGQWLDNVGSIFGTTPDGELAGTRAFRLAWWNSIVHYTVFGPYFWSGKGFGINLADADGFQPTADHSLRAPHNSHLSVLARMGVPGFVLWVLFQAAFAIGLLRAVLRTRERTDPLLAAVGTWVLVVWAAMMVVTSFDPYLEGPQGGIWFWVLIGVGLVVTKLSRASAVEAR